MKAKRGILFGMVLVLALAVSAGTVLAQAALNLSVTKSFGYNLGDQIRGTFRLSASGPGSLRSVTFLIDGQPIQTVSAAPFAVQFQTTTYTDGWHDLSATAETADGQRLASDTRRFQFLSASQQQTGFTKVIAPLLGVVVVIMVGMTAVQFLAFRGRKREPIPLGAHRNYGIRGGSICPRCGRPTPLHLGAINLGFGTKLDMCENCGRYGVLRVRPLVELRRAEEAEIASAQPDLPVREPTPEEKLKQQLDSSRYEDTK
ncbi:MAG TPA: Ig-like domain-containing protein [Anaerolineaceae bacterium]